MSIDNSTCGLDLSKNWTNSSVILTCTERSARPLAIKSEALWFNKKQNSIYCFGGSASFPNTPYVGPTKTPFQSIWAFTPDGNGTGNWREVLGPTGPKPFPPEILPGSGADITSDESHGYYFVYPQDGFSTVNFTDFTITNTTDAHYDEGPMVDVPYYGTSGVLILLSYGSTLSQNTLPYNNITIYDKTKKKWYWQLASGTIPNSPRPRACVAGIRGIESDTFEM